MTLDLAKLRALRDGASLSDGALYLGMRCYYRLPVAQYLEALVNNAEALLAAAEEAETLRKERDELLAAADLASLAWAFELGELKKHITDREHEMRCEAHEKFMETIRRCRQGSEGK